MESQDQFKRHEDTKGVFEAVYRRTDKTVAKKKGQTTINKTLLRKPRRSSNANPTKTGAPEWQAVPAPREASVVLLLLQTQ
jgi:hypothetical protein